MDIQTWRARIGLYYARIHGVQSGPRASYGPSTYSTFIHGRKSLSGGGTQGVLLAMGLLSVAIALFSLLTVAGDVELNPGPGNGDKGAAEAGNWLEDRLVTSHLSKLIKELWETRAKWFIFGIELGIEYSHLDVIKKQNGANPDVCFPEVLSKWLSNSPDCTWKTILSTLREPTVGMNRVADQIEAKHRVGVPEGDPGANNCASDNQHHHISSLREILRVPIRNWMDVGIALNVDRATLESIDAENQGKQEACTQSMLSKWFDKNIEVTYETMVEALFSTGNQATAKELCKDKGIPEPSTVKLPECVREYAESLKTEYLGTPVLQEDPWPPPPCEDYCDLVWSIFKGQETFEAKIEQLFRSSEDKTMPHKILIDGPPGVGKTTLCRNIAKNWAEGKILQEYDLVILVQLRDQRYAQATSYQSFFYHDDVQVTEKVVRHVGQCSGQNILFIFDGFDELSKEERSRGSIFLDIFKGRVLKKSSVIVTSRPEASQALQPLVKPGRHVQLKGFNEDQIKQCVKSSIKGRQKAEKLLNEIKGNLMSLCMIPNNCAIVIYIYKQEDGKLPNTMTDLYSKFISNILDRYANDMVYNKRKQFEEALEKLAYEGLNNFQLTFHPDDIPPEKGSTLGLMTARKSYSSSGRIVTYSFLHLTIQEYFAARWINRTFSKAEKAQFVTRTFFTVCNSFDDSFQETLVFLAGMSKFAELEGDDLFALWISGVQKTQGMLDKVLKYYLSIEGIFEQHMLNFFLTLDHETQSDLLSAQFAENTTDQVLVLFPAQGTKSSAEMLGSFLSKYPVTLERLVMFPSRADNCTFDEYFFPRLKKSRSRVHQLCLHRSSLHRCHGILHYSMFQQLECLEIPYIYKRIGDENNTATNEAQQSAHTDYMALKCLLQKGHLRCLFLGHITPFEADSYVKRWIIPNIPRSSLTTLCLYFDQNVSIAVLVRMFRAIQENNSIKVLYVSIPLDSQTSKPTHWVQSIKKMILGNKSIESFSLTHLKRDSKKYYKSIPELQYKARNFVQCFGQSMTLRRLTLSCTLIQAFFLERLLATNKTLSSLTLNEADSKSDVCYFIARGLKKNSTLKKLCLNSVAKHFGLNVLNGPLHILHTLAQQVHISSDFNLFHLLNCLQFHSSLEVLVFDWVSNIRLLCRNFLTDENQRALCKMLIRNCSLKTVSMFGFEFTANQVAQIATALVLNGKRSEIDLTLWKSYEVSPSDAEMQENLLDSNKREDDISIKELLIGNADSETIQREVDNFLDEMAYMLVTIISHIINTRQQRQARILRRLQFLTITDTNTDVSSIHP